MAPAQAWVGRHAGCGFQLIPKGRRRSARLRTGCGFISDQAFRPCRTHQCGGPSEELLAGNEPARINQARLSSLLPKSAQTAPSRTIGLQPLQMVACCVGGKQEGCGWANLNNWKSDF